MDKRSARRRITGKAWVWVAFGAAALVAVAILDGAALGDRIGAGIELAAAKDGYSSALANAKSQVVADASAHLNFAAAQKASTAYSAAASGLLKAAVGSVIPAQAELFATDVRTIQTAISDVPAEPFLLAEPAAPNTFKSYVTATAILNAQVAVSAVHTKQLLAETATMGNAIERANADLAAMTGIAAPTE